MNSQDKQGAKWNARFAAIWEFQNLKYKPVWVFGLDEQMARGNLRDLGMLKFIRHIPAVRVTA